MKALLRRYAWQIAGVTGAAFVLSALAIVATGADSHRSVTSAAAALSSPAPTHEHHAGVDMSGMDMPTAGPSAEPTASASAEPSATPVVSIDAVPAAASTDKVNTAFGMAVAAIVLSLVATGLAGLALARQPSEGDDDGLDIAG